AAPPAPSNGPSRAPPPTPPIAPAIRFPTFPRSAALTALPLAPPPTRPPITCAIIASMVSSSPLTSNAAYHMALTFKANRLSRRSTENIGSESRPLVRPSQGRPHPARYDIAVLRFPCTRREGNKVPRKKRRASPP